MRRLRHICAGFIICFLAYIAGLPACAQNADLDRKEQSQATKDQSDKFNEPLLNLQSDRAIRLYCSPLNQALARKDYALSSRIMRMIALAFSLDENDTAAAQAALLALKLDPGDNYCCFQAAEYLFRAGHFADGEKLYEKLCSSHDPAKALRARAFLSQSRGLAAESIRLFEQYLPENAGDERALLNLSSLYLLCEDFTNAAKTQRKLAASCQSAYCREIYLGRADEAEKKLKPAESHFLSAGEINRQDPLWHAELALLYLKNQKLKEAKLEFRQCFACPRLMTLAYSNWAVIEAYFGSPTDAQNCLAYALQFRPQAYDLLFACGVINEKEGRLDRAASDFEKALAVNPHTSSPYIHLLQIDQMTKAPLQKRLELCRKWCANCSQSALAALELGNILLESGNENEALAGYLRAETLLQGRLPEDKTLRLMLSSLPAKLAAIFYRRKDWTHSLSEAVRFNACRQQPPVRAGLLLRPARMDLSKLAGKTKTAAEHALVADALFECGQLGLAEQEYRRAQQDDPDNIIYHSCLLKVLLDKKDYGAAAREDIAVSNHVITHIPDILKAGKQKN